MFSIGDKLVEAREKKGKSLKDVEREIKIRAKYLEALEKNNFNLIPGEAYVKIFLREYANFLDIDPDSLVEELEKNQEPAMQSERFLPTGIDSPKKKRSLIWGTFFLVVVAVTGGLILWRAGVLQVQSERAGLARNKESKEQSSEQDQNKGTSSVDEKNLKVKITVVERPGSSLEVEVDGKQVFDERIKSGEVKEWAAKEKIVLTMGNPSALRVEKNGILLEELERKDGRPAVTTLTSSD